MNIYILLKLTLLLTGAVLCCSSDITNKNIEWVSVSQSQSALMEPEPTGLEIDNGITFETYLCRAIHEDDDYFPGKLVLFGNSIHCAYASSGKEYRNGTFEMLNIPTGSTSWMTLEDNNLYPNAVIGSLMTNPDYIAYVCRAKYGNEVVSGFLIRRGDFGNGACYIALDGKEHAVDNRTNIEVLVINQFGIKRGVTQILKPTD